jgi:hypothetical protein
MICILARRGRFLETILKTEPGVASRGRGANRTAGRSGPRPSGFYAWRGQSLAAPVPLPGAGFVGPHPKTATVERREGSRSYRDQGVARRRRDRKNECACRRSITPHRGDGIAAVATAAGAKAPVGPPADAKRKQMRRRPQTRAQQRAKGTNNTALFDIVYRDDGQRFASRAPRCRTRPALAAAETWSFAWRSVRFRRVKYRPTARQVLRRT